MAFSIWGIELAVKRVNLHTNNVALVFILNTKTSKAPKVMTLFRVLVLKGLVHAIHFFETFYSNSFTISYGTGKKII